MFREGEAGWGKLSLGEVEGKLDVGEGDGKEEEELEEKEFGCSFLISSSIETAST